jgi:hypothetical protein
MISSSSKKREQAWGGPIMYEHFGAVVDQNSRVEFKLFFPDNTKDPSQYVRGGLPRIKEIRVRGDFQGQIGGQDWELATAPTLEKISHPKGWLYTCKINQALAEGFYQYKYFVTFENETTRWCGDPCSKYGARMSTKTRASPSAVTARPLIRLPNGFRLKTWCFTS